MRILAIESSLSEGTVAAMEDGRLLREIVLDTERRSTQTLAPTIRDLLADVGWRPNDVQLVAVSVGPGSFTGLRVGIATATAFAYAVGARAMGIDTLAAAAERLPNEATETAVAIDAQRGDWMVGRYSRNAQGYWQPARGPELVDAREWLARLTPETVLTGPALTATSFARIWESVEQRPTLAAESIRIPTAEMVGRIAHREYAAGRRDEPGDIRPIYSRPSAAEEKLRRVSGNQE